MLVAIPILVGALGRVVVGALTDRFGGRVMFIAVSLASILPVLAVGAAGAAGALRCCWCSDSSWASRARFSPSAHGDPDRRRRRRDIDVRAVVRARRTGEDRDAVRLRARRRWGPGAATHPSGSEASLPLPGVPVVPVLAVLAAFYLMLNPS